MKRLLSHDPLTGTQEWFHYDPTTRVTTIETVNPDLTPSLEWTKARRDDQDYWKGGVKREMAHYGHVPNDVLLKWHTMGVPIGDPNALVNMMNRPEWGYLKTTNKVVIGRS